MKIWEKERLLRSTILAGFAAVSMTGASAFAQANDDEDEEDAPAAATDDRVVVTGSLLRRSEYTSASPIQVVTADIQITLGQVDTAEFLQRSSVAQGSTQLNNQFAGFVVEGGTGVNSLSLRGLGAQRTLVILNGRRPGAAGTRGQVGSFDLNVIPSSILQRAEILKDGASSIYGSDAVAGVVNVITRRSVDRPEISVRASVPLDGGGETYDISGAYGWNFSNGSIVVAGEWQLRESLTTGSRSYLACSEDLVTDAQGNRVDREDRSITAGTSLSGCNNLYANTVIDAVFGDRYIPAPDGVTIGLIPGYRPRANQSYLGAEGQAFYEDVLNFDFVGSATAINRQERFSAYAASHFTLDFLGGVEWDTEWLFTRRTTAARGWRQFFPLTGGATALIPGYGYANSPTFASPVPSGIAQPVLPYPSNTDVEVDYYYVATGLDGNLPFSNWVWSLNTSYSYSDGDYTRNSIVASRSGDVQFDDTAPQVDIFDPCFLSGECMDQLVASVGANHTGNTVYDQYVLTAIATGDVFELPAGPVGLAVGAEYRTFSIDDQPSALSRGGDLWGESSALITAGRDTVIEAFAEIEVPLIAGQPFFESLTVNGSLRAFEYDSTGSDHVWKIGANWQINPILRLRATQGTSYRAPALYELFLGNQTAFLGQLAIDPCIDWGNSSNENIRANCAAAGVPDDLAAGGSSATIISGGGDGVLVPETSKALTAGFIFTPTELNFSLALDYFEMEVNDQIARLGGGAILGGCYGSPNFPNAFCDLFDRNPGTHPTAPYRITEVRDSFINVNKQRTTGLDATFRYDHEFSFGDLLVEGQGTWTFSDVQELFDPSLASGFDSNDLNGIIGRPDFVANSRIAFTRGDLTYTWFTNYIQRASNADVGAGSVVTYQGLPNVNRKNFAETTIYHGASVLYRGADWSLLAGISNIFDEHPPTIGTGAATRRGNVPLNGTQYDLRGRTAFVRINRSF
ncbi:MAG: TonB-dependent receptor [Oceanicaulis sp.]|nr:TonB-dependent receptor [Oceanicaulis sp.]